MHAARPVAIALLLTVAAGPSQVPSDAPASAEARTPAAPPFRMLCDGEEFVFAGACTGRFEGAIGLALFDRREEVWSEADDWMLAELGLVNVTDRKANYAPKSSWTGFACGANTGVLLELKGVLPGNFVYDVPMYKCRGYERQNANFELKEMEVFVTPSGARVGELEGVFRGHPDNSVSEGSFHEALVRRFGEKNCAEGHATQFCRAGTRSRIEVTHLQPPLFHVRITTPGVREEARAHAARKIVEARKAAPVNDF